MVTDADRELLDAALDAQERAHCPFSCYPVGAAVRTESGQVYSGCNIESASFSLTCCAERVALFKAVSDGHKQIKSCSIVTVDGTPAPPCGACRQLLSEFGSNMRIILGNPDGDVRILQLGELFPEGFTSEQLLERADGFVGQD